jgi:hypothetical protein
MRSPRSVTLRPIGMPARSLKFETDFLALVITGRCSVMVASSLLAFSSTLLSSLASPTPMLTTIFSTRGTAITLP